MVSVLPCFWLGQCGSSRVYKRRRLSTVRSAQTDFVVQLGISLSFDFIDSSFSNSFRFGFIIFSGESSVLLALPMRKFTRLQAAPSFYGALCTTVFVCS